MQRDFEKTYDTMSWSYLDYMLMCLGVSGLWRKWMRVCFQSNSISLLVNRSPIEEFSIFRGLKQGDPITPFLIIIATKGLAGLIQKVNGDNRYKGFKVDVGLSFSLLQFADDAIFFCDGQERN